MRGDVNEHAAHGARQLVLFCPFCRDAFEGATRCPDHDLALVEWHALPRDAKPLSDDARLSPYALTAGRGWVFLGVGLTLAAFVMPMLTLNGETELHANMLRFASLRAGKLWMVPLSAVAQVMVLFRRRTPRGMRAVRVAVAAVALMPSIAVAFTLRGVQSAAQAVSARTGHPVDVTIEYGCYLVFVAAVVMLYGAFRLGGVASSTASDEAGHPESET